jgi:hypothetical protein
MTTIKPPYTSRARTRIYLSGSKRLGYRVVALPIAGYEDIAALHLMHAPSLRVGDAIVRALRAVIEKDVAGKARRAARNAASYERAGKQETAA